MPRPLLEIDEKVVESFAKLGATNCEIADHFACDEGTIRKRFSEILAKARANRKIRLRELQWKLAEQGNLGMLIWLGKQELGQSEKMDHIVDMDAKIETEDQKSKRLTEVLEALQTKLEFQSDNSK